MRDKELLEKASAALTRGESKENVIRILEQIVNSWCFDKIITYFNHFLIELASFSLSLKDFASLCSEILLISMNSSEV